MAAKITTLEHLRTLASTVEGFTANLVGEVAGTAAEAIEAVEGTAVDAKKTAATAQTNVEAMQKDVDILAYDDKQTLAALNLFIATMQAEVRELRATENVEALQKDIGILAYDNKQTLAALNLFVATTQAEIRELKKLVSTMQAQISAMVS